MCLYMLVGMALGSWTVEDLDAIFLQNAHKAATLRVDWRRTERSTPAALQYTISETAMLERLLVAGEILPQYRDAIQKRVEESKRTKPKLPPPWTMIQDYWSDRSRFQWRFQNDRARGHLYYGESPPRVRHPDVESTPSELPSNLREYMIISGGITSGGGAPVFRTWFGGKGAASRPFQTASTSFKPPTSPGMVEYFPPLALPRENWFGVVHRIDAFFRPNPELAEVLGQQTVQGVNTLVVIKGWLRSADDGTREWEVMRGYLDVERAAIPLRLEEFRARDEHVADLMQTAIISGDAPPLPAWIVRDVKIEKFDGGIWYPTQGFEDQMSDEPSSAGKRRVERVVPHKTMDWQVFRFEPNRAMSSAMFDLSLPAKTALYDETKNETRLTGEVDEYGEVIIHRALSRQKASGSWWTVLAWSAICAFLAVSCYAFFRRIR